MGFLLTVPPYREMTAIGNILLYCILQPHYFILFEIHNASPLTMTNLLHDMKQRLMIWYRPDYYINNYSVKVYF